jgi:cytidyltransferase-like protein
VRKVLLFGVFDLFHFGHLRIINHAARLGDYLVVAVQEDAYIARFKPEAANAPLYTLSERIEMIRALRWVDEVIPFATVEEDIKKIDFDIYVRGAEKAHSGIIAAMDWCKANGKEVVQLPRTEGISSTYLKNLARDFSPSN